MDSLLAWSKRAIALLLALATSGCILGLMLGRTTVTRVDELFELTNAVIEAKATTGVCLATITPSPSTAIKPADSGIECSYYIDGMVVTSTTQLRFLEGAFFVLYDPVVVQVLANATIVSATYSGAAGSGALEVTNVTGGLRADATTRINPEPGHRLVVLDFPAPSPPIGTYDFSLALSIPGNATPVRLKTLFAGKVTVGNAKFYPPLLPCTTDLSTIPAIALPVSDSPQAVNLTGLNLQVGCKQKVYTFIGPPVVGDDVVEYYNEALDHYFITRLPSEVAILDAGVQIKGWVRTGQILRAHSAPQAGTSPVCRYYLPPLFGDSHFFGRGTVECDATGQAHPAFVLEDPAFLHVYLPTAGVCQAGTRPVYRVFSNRPDANHRYMVDRAIRDEMVAKGWLAEGDGPDRVVWCEPS